MGGHGGLNILPQKRWNVYNFENREKVRKDEEEAARKEQEEQHKARARDAEFRLEKLKEAANSRKRQERKATAPPTEASEIPVLAASPVDHDVETRHHINLFADLEAKEREEEAKLPEQKNFGKKQEVNVHKRSEKAGDEREKSIRKRKDEDIPKLDENAAYALGFGSYEKKGKRPWYMSESSLMKDDNHSEAQTSPSATEHAEKRKKTMEELRAERIKREEQERVRARLVFPTAAVPKRPNGVQGHFQARRNSFRYNSGYGNS